MYICVCDMDVFVHMCMQEYTYKFTLVVVCMHQCTHAPEDQRSRLVSASISIHLTLEIGSVIKPVAHWFT